MVVFRVLILTWLLATLVAPAIADQTAAPLSLRSAQAVSCSATCGRVSSCIQAVYLWCVCGYRRADRDRDGIPCEKLCGQSSPSNLKRIRSMMQDLGCSLR